MSSFKVFGHDKFKLFFVKLIEKERYHGKQIAQAAHQRYHEENPRRGKGGLRLCVGVKRAVVSHNGKDQTGYGYIYAVLEFAHKCQYGKACAFKSFARQIFQMVHAVAYK